MLFHLAQWITSLDIAEIGAIETVTRLTGYITMKAMVPFNSLTAMEPSSSPINAYSHAV